MDLIKYITAVFEVLKGTYNFNVCEYRKKTHIYGGEAIKTILKQVNFFMESGRYVSFYSLWLGFHLIFLKEATFYVINEIHFKISVKCILNNSILSSRYS